MVFREVGNSVQEEGRVPLHEVDGQLFLIRGGWWSLTPPLLSALRGQLPAS